jgi:hypothetical protein
MSSVSGQDIRFVPYVSDPAGRPIFVSRPAVAADIISAPATNPKLTVTADGADLTFFAMQRAGAEGGRTYATIGTLTPRLSYSSSLYSDESEATTINEQPNPLASLAILRLPQSGSLSEQQCSSIHDTFRPLTPIPPTPSPPPSSSSAVLSSTPSSDLPHSHGQTMVESDERLRWKEEKAREEKARKILEQNRTGVIEEESPEWYLTKFMERSITPKGASGLLVSLKTNEIGCVSHYFSVILGILTKVLVVGDRWLQQFIAMKGMQVLVQFISHMSRKGEQRFVMSSCLHLFRSTIPQGRKPTICWNTKLLVV